jgi:putative endonuclease
MYYVYLLYSSKVNECYIGWTTDLRRRLREHNSDLSFATHQHGPYELIYYEAYSHREEALGRERSMKEHPNVPRQLKQRLFRSLPRASSEQKEVVG